MENYTFKTSEELRKFREALGNEAVVVLDLGGRNVFEIAPLWSMGLDELVKIRTAETFTCNRFSADYQHYGVRTPFGDVRCCPNDIVLLEVNSDRGWKKTNGKTTILPPGFAWGQYKVPEARGVREKYAGSIYVIGSEGQSVSLKEVQDRIKKIIYSEEQLAYEDILDYPERLKREEADLQKKIEELQYKLKYNRSAQATASEKVERDIRDGLYMTSFTYKEIEEAFYDKIYDDLGWPLVEDGVAELGFEIISPNEVVWLIGVGYGSNEEVFRYTIKRNEDGQMGLIKPEN